jgi:hypothetical protein
MQPCQRNIRAKERRTQEGENTPQEDSRSCTRTQSGTLHHLEEIADRRRIIDVLANQLVPSVSADTAGAPTTTDGATTIP